MAGTSHGTRGHGGPGAGGRDGRASRTRVPDPGEAGRAEGRAQWALAAAIGAAGLAAACLVMLARAEAATDKAKAAKARCEASAGELGRGAALEELRAAGDSESRKAIEELADSTDDRIAAQAIATLGRSDHSGARTKLKSIAADTARSDAARCTALTAWLRLEKKDGRTWSDVSGDVSNWATKGSRLEQTADAMKSAVFGVTTGGGK
ncbi:MAG: hypothetical protein HMLKMBBP_02690 [Planctomycetes bacterium]|nr:hypothetical protein [Planctomycetota bacterium]